MPLCDEFKGDNGISDLIYAILPFNFKTFLPDKCGADIVFSTGTTAAQPSSSSCETPFWLE